MNEVPLLGAAVADRGKTQHVVWVTTSEIDLQAPADSQTGAIIEALGIASGIAAWYVAVEDRLFAPANTMSDIETSGGVL